MSSLRETGPNGDPIKLEIVSLVWRGTSPVAAPVALKTAAAGSSFLISNRAQTFLANSTYPLPGGGMYWFVSTAQANDPNPDNYNQLNSTPSGTAPDAFTQAIKGILQGQSDPQLTIFVHGLGTLFPNAIWGTSALGASLLAFGQYPGLTIGFDWPSYDVMWSGLYYASNGSPYYFPPIATSGTIRDNINGSRPAFQNLLAFLSGLRSAIAGLKISLVCHSEGNYMAMLGLLGNTSNQFEHVLLLAADINNAALEAPDNNSLVGQGNGIVQAGGDVTVYFTGNDDVLPISQYAYEYDYHNPAFGSRLGSMGPSYNAGPQSANVYSVDCSDVINVQNFQLLESEGVIPSNPDGSSLSMHTSYLYIPQVAADMAAVLTGSSPGNIANRTATANPGGYFMNVVAEESTGEPAEQRAGKEPAFA